LDAEIATLGGGAAVATRAATAASAGSSTESGTQAGLRRAILEARSRFQPSHFVEIGVGCEACHGGSREHADDPRRRPTFEPRAPFLDVARLASREASADRGRAITEAEWQNRACARCHQVLFSRYPRTWEGGVRRAPEGRAWPATCPGKTWALATSSRAITASARPPTERASRATGRSSARSATLTRPSARCWATSRGCGASATTRRRSCGCTAG